MIHVVAEITVGHGRRDDFLDKFHRLRPDVLAEEGCLEYGPVLDLETEIAVQLPTRDNVVTVIEKWATLDALRAHLAAPHMEAYREHVKDIVQGVTLRVYTPG